MKLILNWSDDQDICPIPDDLIEKLELILQEAGIVEGIESGEVSLSFVNNEAIHTLNRDYRGVDKETDVLSFAMNDNEDEEQEIIFEDEQHDLFELMLGDIIISVPKALEQSKQYGHSFEREIGFLFIHGFLHLLGYDHETDQEELVMFAKQDEILLRVGLTR